MKEKKKTNIGKQLPQWQNKPTQQLVSVQHWLNLGQNSSFHGFIWTLFNTLASQRWEHSVTPAKWKPAVISFYSVLQSAHSCAEMCKVDPVNQRRGFNVKCQRCRERQHTLTFVIYYRHYNDRDRSRGKRNQSNTHTVLHRLAGYPGVSLNWRGWVPFQLAWIMLNLYIPIQRATTLSPTFTCCAINVSTCICYVRANFFHQNSEISPCYFGACSSHSRCERGYGDVHPGCVINYSWQLGPAPKDTTAFSRAIFNLYGSPSPSFESQFGESDLIPNLKCAALQHGA